MHKTSLHKNQTIFIPTLNFHLHYLLSLSPPQVKQIMEEAVTRKFVHEDSSRIVSFCGKTIEPYLKCVSAVEQPCILVFKGRETQSKMAHI